MDLKKLEFTIIDSIIIIHWYVNKSIDLTNYNFTQLIFSNYDNINICMKTDNKYNDKYRNYQKISQFNNLVFLF